MFDARVFNVPFEEVTNCLLWRQLDAKRNSVQMLGRYYFTHRELQNKSCEDIKRMLLEYDNVDWNDLPTELKWGSCCVKEQLNTEDCVDQYDHNSNSHRHLFPP